MTVKSVKDIEEFEEKYAELTSLFLDSMKDIAEELKRPYPDWTEIAKNFAFGMKMFTRADEAVIRFIADVKELMSEYAKLKLKVEQIERIKEKRAKKEEIEKDFERWYQDVLASLNGDKNAKNVVVLLYKFGGITWKINLQDAIKVDNKTIRQILSNLEKKGVIKVAKIGPSSQRADIIVHFNHPKFANLTFDEIIYLLSDKQMLKQTVNTSGVDERSRLENNHVMEDKSDDVLEDDLSEIDELIKEV